MPLGAASDEFPRGKATDRMRGLRRLPIPDKLRMLGNDVRERGAGC